MANSCYNVYRIKNELCVLILHPANGDPINRCVTGQVIENEVPAIKGRFFFSIKKYRKVLTIPKHLRYYKSIINERMKDDMQTIESKQMTMADVTALIDEERGTPKAGIVSFKPIDPNSRLAKLYRMQSEIIKRDREAWQDKHYREEVDCTFEGHTGHKAILHKHGHRYAGVIECVATGESDSCEHLETHTEAIEVDVFEPVFGHDTREEIVSVCDACECSVED